MKPGAVIVAVFAFVIVTTLTRAQGSPPATQPEKLADLVSEAERNNPEIHAARQRWDASRQVPSQVSTLPDPEVMFQQLNVGSPRPFSGYTNSEMANVALGVSQDIPYPGKLKLRGQIATKEAEVWQEQYRSVSRTILDDVKGNYFQLSYLAIKLGILQADQELLKPVEQSAEAHFRQGTGSEEDVLQAQLEETRVLREVTATQLRAGTVQAKLKQLLNRPQSSPDIVAAQLSETLVPYTYAELLTAAQSDNPDIAVAQHMIERQSLEVDLAHKDFDPDFNVQYVWLRPDPFNYRARYQLSVGIRIPIYRTRRQGHELAEAEIEKSRARTELEAESQQIASELRQQYVTAEQSAKLLKIYREGLLPQARAEFQAGMAAYASAREDFQALLASFVDVLTLDEQYWQTLDEHETALAKIEETTGLSLR
jgi:outer membrane protein, heavy metal efflux system